MISMTGPHRRSEGIVGGFPSGDFLLLKVKRWVPRSPEQRQYMILKRMLYQEADRVNQGARART